ncbi:MAG TPA: hypothetical protein VGG05_03565 [Pseudonocardiaceae bacterium]
MSQRFRVGSPYIAVVARRVLDTRDGTGGVPAGPLGPHGMVSLHLAGTQGIPATGVRAVVLNVTAVNPTASGSLTLYPDLTNRPAVSNLNDVAGRTVSNLVTVPVGANGAVDFFNDTGTVYVVADLEGYYVDGPAFHGGGFLTSLTPQRLLDTRDVNGVTQGAPVGPGGVVQVPVGQVDHPQAPLQAVVLHITATDTTATSFLTVYQDGTTRPSTADLTVTPGHTTSNLVIVPATSGTVDIFNDTGSVHVIVDVEAYYTQPIVFQPDLGGSPFTPTPPTRLLDTRTGTGGHRSALGPGGVAVLTATGVPDDATSVLLNVTAVAPTESTFVTVYPGGIARLATSALDADAGQTVSNLVVVPIGPQGKIDFANDRGRINLIADLEGYFTG